MSDKGRNAIRSSVPVWESAKEMTYIGDNVPSRCVRFVFLYRPAPNREAQPAK